LKQAKGLAGIDVNGKRDLLFEEKLACERCSISLPELEPRHFTFNSAHGACPACDGLGH